MSDLGMTLPGVPLFGVLPLKPPAPRRNRQDAPSTRPDDLVLISLALRDPPLARPVRRRAAPSESSHP
ncbi:hypothetical protein ACWEFL_19450 [Streptomyces sp. NPDC004838]